MRVVFTAEALDDLAHIRERIERENPQTAPQIIVQIISTCDRLEYQPGRGRPGLVAGTYELPAIWPYVIVYKIDASAGIVRILRSARAAHNSESWKVLLS